MKKWDIGIIGCGIAGVSAAKAIVQSKPSLAILMVNGENRLPYKRTKLSKFLASGFSKNQFALELEDWYHSNNITLVTGVTVSRIAPEQYSLMLSNGEKVLWKKLILATGARPSRSELVAQGTKNFFTVREAKEAEVLVGSLPNITKALVVGAGVLGVEVVYQLQKMGVDVSLVGLSAGPMKRHLNKETSELLKNRMRDAGVHLFFDTKIDEIQDNSKSFDVNIKGKQHQYDCIIECIGSDPNIDLAEQAGILCRKGIVVNTGMRTSLDDIYAAGDCTEIEDGTVAHLWHGAEYQGHCAGLNAIGEKKNHTPRPFRVKCEVFGEYFFSMNYSQQSDETITFTGGPIKQYFYMNNSRVSGIVMVGDKERAKIYEKAVLESWSEDELRAELI